MKRLIIKVIGGVTICLACLIGLVAMYGPRYNLYLLPPSPEQYGRVALEQIDRLGLYASGNEWEQVKSDTLVQLKTSQSYEDSLNRLKPALKQAGGKHSFLVPANEVKDAFSSKDLPSSHLSEDGVLYLSLPELMTNDTKVMDNYAQTLKDALGQQGYSGIIIDLRDNGGWTMHPMLAGLLPLFPQQTLLSFEDRTGRRIPVTSADLSWGGSFTVTGDKESVPLAVLINDGTGSSAEIVALAFKNLPKVKLFGQQTAGYTTGNQVLTLYDGASIGLTTLRLVSHDGQVYENTPISPDVVTDQAEEEARKWLETE